MYLQELLHPIEEATQSRNNLRFSVLRSYAYRAIARLFLIKKIDPIILRFNGIEETCPTTWVIAKLCLEEGLHNLIGSGYKNPSRELLGVIP